MPEAPKTCVTVAATYEDGEAMMAETILLADPRMRRFAKHDAFRSVELRLVVPTELAEELLEGLRAGRVQLDVSYIPRLINRT